jgi:sugar/nucleoside kinase (ribokinase family)
MLSKVGDDAFGKLLIATLVHYGVATEGVLTTREGNTSLAVVTIAAGGERDFTLYRKGCAESTFGAAEVATDIIRCSRVLHVGSLLLGEPISRAAQRHAVRTARVRRASSSPSTSICDRRCGKTRRKCAPSLSKGPRRPMSSRSVRKS